MMARFGMIVYGVGLGISFTCGMAALTILVAMVTNKISDSGDWIAAVFFASVGGLCWLAGRAAKSILAGIWSSRGPLSVEIGPDLFRAACQMGLEGLVSKRRDRPYQAGRSKHWLKVKNRKHPAMSRAMWARQERRKSIHRQQVEHDDSWSEAEDHGNNILERGSAAFSTAHRALGISVSDPVAPRGLDTVPNIREGARCAR
jgi:hypothetical protein